LPRYYSFASRCRPDRPALRHDSVAHITVAQPTDLDGGQTLAPSNLHADIWWPLLLLAVGLFYTIRHWPFKGPAKP
jgi:hypothetical protein